MSDLLLNDLKQQIAARQAVVIVGTGVSISATNNHPCASWQGLLRSGVERCMQVVPGLKKEWETRTLEQIHGDLVELLSAADNISQRLGAPNGGEYARWLRETVGTLEPVKRDVIEALHRLGVTLATTNYDSLIEDVTRLDPVTWMDGNAVERVVRGDDKGILHLHGFWKKPESVVLGISSYEKVLGNEHAQNILHALQTMKTLLFVGCADGLEDPNFGKLMEWTGRIFSGSEYRRFCLTRESQVEKLQKAHPPDQRLFVLSYDKSFDDLAPFLRSLGSSHANSVAAAQPAISVLLPPKPRCFGRDDEVADLVATLLADHPDPTPILGPPGIGKSTLTLAALHHEKVISKYGAHRYFIRCDAIKSRLELASAIALALGLQPTATVETTLLSELGKSPVALALDNAETPFENDTLAVEEFLAAISGIPTLALIASLRGAERPASVSWREPIEPKVLKLPAARETFLAIAGKKFQSDPTLDLLVGAVDYVPLAITLLAHQAEGEPDLLALWQRWQDERTAMLQRAGGKDRLTNIELSYELSIQSPRLTAQGRQLLTVLAMLPDGFALGDIPAIFPGHGAAAAASLRKAGLAFDESARLRLLAPLREYVGRQLPPEPTDGNRLVDFYLTLAKLASRLGTVGGADAGRRITPETANIEA